LNKIDPTIYEDHNPTPHSVYVDPAHDHVAWVESVSTNSNGATRYQGLSVQAVWDGWIAGTTPADNPRAIGRSDCPLAGVAAGALAVGQALLFKQGDLRAGRNTQDLSLWSGQASDVNDIQDAPSFDQVLLPGGLWLVGLGNLGQAYLWSLALQPYSRPEDVMLFLQDDQIVGRENWGTFVLVQRGRYNLLKTRLAEEWATARGFQVRRIDRRLDEHLLRSQQEPGIALAGLDRMPPRRILGRCGFEYKIDAGLGATAIEYRKIRLNVFNSDENPADHQNGSEDVAGSLRTNPWTGRSSLHRFLINCA
jgi:hypothetical protein